MYPKEELIQMIIDTDKKGKMLQNASPMINVSEAVHGVYAANFISNTATLPNVPLGAINDDDDAYSVTERNRQEVEL